MSDNEGRIPSPLHHHTNHLQPATTAIYREHDEPSILSTDANAGHPTRGETVRLAGEGGGNGGSHPNDGNGGEKHLNAKAAASSASNSANPSAVATPTTEAASSPQPKPKINTGASELARMHSEPPSVQLERQREQAIAASNAAGFHYVESNPNFERSYRGDSSSAAPHYHNNNSSGSGQLWIKGNSMSGYPSSSAMGNNTSGNSPSVGAHSSSYNGDEHHKAGGVRAVPGRLLHGVANLAHNTATALRFHSPSTDRHNDNQHGSLEGANTNASTYDDNNDENDPHYSSATVRIVKRSEAKAAEMHYKMQEKRLERERAAIGSNTLGGGGGMMGVGGANSPTTIIGAGNHRHHARFPSEGRSGAGSPTGGGGGEYSDVDNSTVYVIDQNGEVSFGASGSISSAGGGAGGNGHQSRSSIGGGGNSSMHMPSTLLPPATDPVWSHSKKLYMSYFFAAWGGRMWEFAAIVFIVDGLFPDSLLASSLFGLFEALSGIIGAGTAGRMVDNNGRLGVMRTGIITQNVGIVVGMTLLAVAMMIGGSSLHIGARIGFLVGVIACGVVSKFGSLLGRLAVNKDWVVVIANGNRSVQAHLNACITRVDMLCQILAPIVVGVASALIGATSASLFVGIWALVSTLIELRLCVYVYNAVPALAINRTIISYQVSNIVVLSPITTAVAPQTSSLRSGGSTALGMGAATTMSSPSPLPRPAPMAVIPNPTTSASAASAAGGQDLSIIYSQTNPVASSAPPAVGTNGSSGVAGILNNSGGAADASVSAASSSQPTTNATSFNDSISVRFDTDDNEGNRLSGGCGSLVRRMNASIRRTIKAWRVYRAHPCFWVSIPFAVLSISVLNFGGIMVSYLKTLGCTDDALAIGRGVSALVAIIPTFAVPYFIPRKGLYVTGRFMLWAQVVCLLPIAAALYFGIHTYGVSSEQELIRQVDELTHTEVLKYAPEDMPLVFIIIVFISLCLSRFGLWGFDLAQRQMMQELVDKAETGRVNASQELAVNICWLLSFVLTIIFSDPSMFMYPAYVSFGAVVVAALLYSFVGMSTTAAVRDNQASGLAYA